MNVKKKTTNESVDDPRERGEVVIRMMERVAFLTPIIDPVCLCEPHQCHEKRYLLESVVNNMPTILALMRLGMQPRPVRRERKKP